MSSSYSLISLWFNGNRTEKNSSESTNFNTSVTDPNFAQEVWSSCTLSSMEFVYSPQPSSTAAEAEDVESGSCEPEPTGSGLLEHDSCYSDSCEIDFGESDSHKDDSCDFSCTGSPGASSYDAEAWNSHCITNSSQNNSSDIESSQSNSSDIESSLVVSHHNSDTCPEFSNPYLICNTPNIVYEAEVPLHTQDKLPEWIFLSNEDIWEKYGGYEGPRPQQTKSQSVSRIAAELIVAAGKTFSLPYAPLFTPALQPKQFSENDVSSIETLTEQKGPEKRSSKPCIWD